jgi:hypothetical protein
MCLLMLILTKMRLVLERCREHACRFGTAVVFTALSANMLRKHQLRAQPELKQTSPHPLPSPGRRVPFLRSPEDGTKSQRLLSQSQAGQPRFAEGNRDYQVSQGCVASSVQAVL